MNIFPNLSEDVWVLWRGENGVEVSLVEAFTGSKYVSCCFWRRE